MPIEVLELCMQETLIKGNILTNFEDSNSAVCVPKQIIDELYCPTHDTIKPQWALMLSSFHKYPRNIRWKEWKKWAGKNTLKNKKDFKGLKLQFTCAQQKDGCIAQCEWTSLGLVEHQEMQHVVFTITFREE